jgi:hypothetical protein
VGYAKDTLTREKRLKYFLVVDSYHSNAGSYLSFFLVTSQTSNKMLALLPLATYSSRFLELDEQFSRVE